MRDDVTPFAHKPVVADNSTGPPGPPSRKRTLQAQEREDSDGEVEGAGIVMDIALDAWDLSHEHLQSILTIEAECKHRGIVWQELNIHAKDVMSAHMRTVEIAAGLGERFYVGVTSNPQWRMEGCKVRGWQAHCDRFNHMFLTVCGPAEHMKDVERATIQECRVQGLELVNSERSKGGERIGKGYLAFVYVATCCAPSCAVYWSDGVMHVRRE